MATKKPPTLQDLASSISAWQGRTFPDRTVHSVAGHIRKEAAEILDECARHDHMTGQLLVPLQAKDTVNADRIGEECADLFHLLVAMSDAAGFNLREQVARKYLINLDREWGKPDGDGIVEHIRK